ncbi:unnamed protein product [Moneuplotes crassus]|uniref:Uncharacterized protein n=1 Tax=Euplotes crassus TaxID=5936 RepID=A0AAD1UGI5_EUPCR|nr:unnamed protein product [Moneuplotes crassus]
MNATKINKWIPRETIQELDEDCFEMRMPNIAKIQSQPFDPENYQPEKAIQYKNEHGLIKEKSFNLLNVIRWRYTDSTTEPFVLTDKAKQMQEAVGYKPRYPDKQIESNAKIVEWSDGTFSMMIGDEILDLNFSKTTNSHLYLKTDDLLVHKNKVNRKCLVKPSKESKRAMRSIVQNANEKAKEKHQVEKKCSLDDDPRSRKRRHYDRIDNKNNLERKRARRNFLMYND